MLSGWRITVLLLLLEAAGSEAQSGDGDLDTELQLSCSSHISIKGPGNLTCQLLGRRGNEDDEDGEGETIKKMIVCQVHIRREKKCFQAHGSTVTSEDLKPLPAVNVTVHRKGGGQISATFYLQKIVKPKSPQVWNVTSEPQLNRTVVYIQIPYSKDYLTLENQIFQLNLWTKGSNITQNISSQNFLQINMQHLRKHSEYHVKVRAIPNEHKRGLQGTWSEWSKVYTFFTPPEEKRPPSPEEWQLTMYVLIVSFISVVVVLSSIFVFWKNKIFTYMWPSIPHPKQTLVKICKPNKGLLLNLNPEVFSSLKVYPLEKTNFEEAEPSLGPAAADGSQSSSNQSFDCRSTTSVSTEELEISALLSRSASYGEDSLPSSSPSPVMVLQREDEAQNFQPENGSRGNAVGTNQPEEAYVTMSSFYQIK
ncbi:hypothetical protein CHARACLAT_023411 [Characodon lateralis]|uniref:Fibronectin type-III domain-containing protein n=1 Tax=Characodon lateralis TaxID=208331 RepID=A0ABU7CRD1_9TELE|nr:hypothetical protein [Characodon lateralis]